MLRVKGKLNSLAGVSYIGLIGCGSILFLLLTVFILMPSFADNQATAINNGSGISTYSTITTPSVSISLPDSIAFSEVVPTPDGATTTASTSFSVATTESDGYSLYLYSEGGNSLKSSNPANISSIIATQGDVGLTLSSLKPNTWGYNLGTAAPDDNTTYIGIPTDSTTPIRTKDTSTTGQANDTYTLSFGAKVDSSIPSGAYSNTLTVAVVALPQVIIADELPSGIDPDVYTSTNPGAVDVYPTTGWGDDVIAITSDGQFSNITSVTIGGTDCEPYQVVNEHLIACKLPTKAASADNGYEVAVTTSTGDIDMHNFTVRYFNPANITSMQDFTATTCGSMNVGDIIPLVDERNRQVYRVKKMQDGKCWMIDNMKYTGADVSISNVDGTNGVAYNNEASKYNTVDGTSNQSTANSDKAFYNNPMGEEYCYSTGLSTSYTKCGYSYNWYAATAGTGTWATEEYAQVSGSICPTNWRLPSSVYSSNGVGYSYSTTDFPVLNASMNAGGVATGSDSNYPAGWQFAGAWSGTFAGVWVDNFNYGSETLPGTSGFYWSSNASETDWAYVMYITDTLSGPLYRMNEYAGASIRCVMDGVVTIAFDGNGATSGSMSSIKIPAGGQQTLPSNTFTRDGYVFNGWNTASNGSGTSYADGANYTASTSYTGRTVTLYAQWRTLINHLGDVTYMQDFTPTLCDTSDIGATTRLIDRRDGKYYWVAKLADGNCWMTQNLALDLSTSRTLTPNDSDVTNNWTPNASTSSLENFDHMDDNGEHSYNPGLFVKVDPMDYDTTCDTNVTTINGCAGWQDVSSMTPMTTTRTDGIVVSANTYDAHFLTGNYYQWNAATAGTGGASNNWGTAEDSICPRGWRLPTGGTSGELRTLLTGVSSASIVKYPYFYPPAGIVAGSVRPRLYDVGNIGRYWASTHSSSSANSLDFTLDLGFLSAANSSSTRQGLTVRCVAK